MVSSDHEQHYLLYNRVISNISRTSQFSYKQPRSPGLGSSERILLDGMGWAPTSNQIGIEAQPAGFGAQSFAKTRRDRFTPGVRFWLGPASVSVDLLTGHSPYQHDQNYSSTRSHCTSTSCQDSAKTLRVEPRSAKTLSSAHQKVQVMREISLFPLGPF